MCTRLGANSFIDVGATATKKVEPSTRDGDDDSSDGDLDFSSGDEDSSEAEQGPLSASKQLGSGSLASSLAGLGLQLSPETICC